MSRKGPVGSGLRMETLASESREVDEISALSSGAAVWLVVLAGSQPQPQMGIHAKRLSATCKHSNQSALLAEDPVLEVLFANGSVSISPTMSLRHHGIGINC